jgi:hypothetical protein
MASLEVTEHTRLPPGTRVRVQPPANLLGSTVRLKGLTATVLEPHPIAYGWCRIRLDPNEQEPELVWPVAYERLIPMHMDRLS